MTDTTSRQNSNMTTSVATASSTSAAAAPSSNNSSSGSGSSNPTKKQYISKENRKRHGTFLDSIVQDPSKEQKSVYDVIYETDDYFPWGKPGGGAPKLDSYGRTKTKLAGSLKWENSNAGENNDRSPVRNYDILSGKSHVSASVVSNAPKPKAAAAPPATNGSQAPVGVREMPHFNPRIYGPARYETTPRAEPPPLPQMKPQQQQLEPPRISPIPPKFESASISHFNQQHHQSNLDFQQTPRPILPPPPLNLAGPLPPLASNRTACGPPGAMMLVDSPRLSFRAHPHYPFHKERVQAVALASAPAAVNDHHNQQQQQQRLEMSMLERQAHLRHQSNVLRSSTGDSTVLTSNTMENRLFGRNQPTNDYPNFPFWFGRMGPNQLTPRGSNRFYQQSAPVHLPSHSQMSNHLPQQQQQQQQYHHHATAPTPRYWPSNTFTSYSTNNLAF